MKCTSCGTELAEGALLCSHCGRVVDTSEAIRQRSAGGLMSKKDFGELPGVKSCRNNINSCAIILYVCAVVSLVMWIIQMSKLSLDGIDLFLAIILNASDSMVLVALGVWLQLGKSRISALIVLVYGIGNMLYMSAQLEKLAGWWIPLAGVYAVIYTFKYNKLWNQYRKTGDVPDKAVREG